MSIVIVATAVPKPEHRDEVIALFERAISTVHADDAGCELYALNEGKDRLVMVEKWADRDALNAHARSDGLAALTAGLEGLLAQDIDVQVLTPHPAGDTELGAV
jgi:quinol monooxygenase YgiN